MKIKTRWILILTLFVIGMIGLVTTFTLFTKRIPSITTFTPVPTQTKEEKLLTEMQHHSSQSASSVDECTEILRNENGCNVMKSVERITRPEWDKLFPQTEFFLVKYDRYTNEFSPQQRYLLIIEQDGKRYTPNTFDHLLTSNDIAITNKNRELVAEALVLMMLPGYLKEEIEFSNWEEGNWSSAIRVDYNYRLTVWTKIQGLEIQFLFIFYESNLVGAGGDIIEYNVGDYIDISFETLPSPSRESLTYWRR